MPPALIPPAEAMMSAREHAIGLGADEVVDADGDASHRWPDGREASVNLRQPRRWADCGARRRALPGTVVRHGHAPNLEHREAQHRQPREDAGQFLRVAGSPYQDRPVALGLQAAQLREQPAEQLLRQVLGEMEMVGRAGSTSSRGTVARVRGARRRRSTPSPVGSSGSLTCLHRASEPSVSQLGAACQRPGHG